MNKTMLFALAALASAFTAGAESPAMPEPQAIEVKEVLADSVGEPLVYEVPEAYSPDAPDFQLVNIDGKETRLSDFRGKWVIVDFWGSWCPWCIKGFPKLKETYAQVKDKVEVIGVDCGDTPEVWKEAVKHYQLPWVNLYNPMEGGESLLDAYNIQGFPTKVIIDPEGKIRNVTSGENPVFYDVLFDLIK